MIQIKSAGYACSLQLCRRSVTSSSVVGMIWENILYFLPNLGIWIIRQDGICEQIRKATLGLNYFKRQKTWLNLKGRLLKKEHVLTSSNLRSPDRQDVSSSCWTLGICPTCSFSKKIWNVYAPWDVSCLDLKWNPLSTLHTFKSWRCVRWLAQDLTWAWAVAPCRAPSERGLWWTPLDLQRSKATFRIKTVGIRTLSCKSSLYSNIFQHCTLQIWCRPFSSVRNVSQPSWLRKFITMAAGTNPCLQNIY